MLKGTHHTKETLKKIGIASANREYSDDWKKRNSELRKQEWKSGKRVGGWKLSKKTKKKLSIIHGKEEKSREWKGDKVKYRALHQWVVRQLGKPYKCENINCSYPNPKRFEWANISGKYLRSLGLKDWKMMCPSCHRLFDKGRE